MTEFPDIEKMKKRTFQIYNQDGITEMCLGCIIYFVALAYQNLAFIGVTCSFIIFAPVLLPKLRDKYFYPRLGYVKIKIEPLSKNRALVLFSVFICDLIIKTILMNLINNTIINLEIWQKWLPIFFSGIILVYSLEMIRHSGKIIYIFTYIIALSWGLFISLAPLGISDPIDYFAVYLLLMGIFWVIFGGIKLKRFINRNPLLKEEGDYNGQERNN